MTHGMQIGLLCFTILAGGLAKLVNRAARLQGVQLGRCRARAGCRSCPSSTSSSEPERRPDRISPGLDLACFPRNTQQLCAGGPNVPPAPLDVGWFSDVLSKIYGSDELGSLSSAHVVV